VAVISAGVKALQRADWHCTALYRAAAAAAAAPYSATHSLSTATGFMDSKENK